MSSSIKQVRSCGYSAMRLKKKKVESTLGGMELLRSGWAMRISSSSSCYWKERWMNVGEHGCQNSVNPGCGEPWRLSGRKDCGLRTGRVSKVLQEWEPRNNSPGFWSCLPFESPRNCPRSWQSPDMLNQWPKASWGNWISISNLIAI